MLRCAFDFVNEKRDDPTCSQFPDENKDAKRDTYPLLSSSTPCSLILAFSSLSDGSEGKAPGWNAFLVDFPTGFVVGVLANDCSSSCRAISSCDSKLLTLLTNFCCFARSFLEGCFFTCCDTSLASDVVECRFTEGSWMCEVAFLSVWKDGVRRFKEDRRPDPLGIGVIDLST